MRMMVRWTVPVERGNEAIRTGTMTRTIEEVTEMVRPEAAYFWADRGRRAGMLVFDMTDTSQIPQIAEPLFHNLDADVEFVPAMDAEDLKKALAAIDVDAST